MPGLGVGGDFARGKFAHLRADGFQRLVEPAVAADRLRVIAHQRDKARSQRRRVAVGDHRFDRGRNAGRDGGRRKPEIGEPHELALTHRDAAEDLGQIFTKPDADNHLLDLSHARGGLHALGVTRELPQRLDVGGEPGKAVGGALLPVEQVRPDATFDRDALAYAVGRVSEQSLHRHDRVASARGEIVSSVRAGRSKRHH